MPSGITAATLFTDALSLTNAIGADQTLTAGETSLCLRKMNDLLENLSLQSLAVYQQVAQTFVTVAGQASYTIGPSGNWNTVRPVRINTPAYSSISAGINTLSVPIVEIAKSQYDIIPLKSQQQVYPNYFVYENAFPLGVVTLWPTPSQVVNVTLEIDTELTAVSSSATVLSFPPGYCHAFTYNLAALLAPIFGKRMADYADVLMEAKRSLGDIKRANAVPVRSQYDNAVLGQYWWPDWRRGY
jgi:hypothetical protein